MTPEMEAMFKEVEEKWIDLVGPKFDGIHLIEALRELIEDGEATLFRRDGTIYISKFYRA